MGENQNTAALTAAENTETTVEQITAQGEAAGQEGASAPQTDGNLPKTYTEDELNAKVDEIIGRKLARREAKIRREYSQKYGELENVLKAGTGKDNIGEITEGFRQYYGQKGIKISDSPALSDKDQETLGRVEAEDIIRSGYDEVVEEVDRLAKIGAANMTAREKAVFRSLAEHRRTAERDRELSRLGVDERVYSGKEFRDFAGKFTSEVPATEIYDLYTKTAKQEKIEPIGSMKNGSHDNEKTYYSPEDVDKLTEKDLDNPVIFQRVRESMKSWK